MKEVKAIKNKQILQLIIQYIQKHGYPPTVEEIRVMTGYKSKNTVWVHLKQMKDAGMIETDAGMTARAIRVPGYRYVKEAER